MVKLSKRSDSRFVNWGWFAEALIRGYQRTLSADHGPLRTLWLRPRCKFYPTCSEYARRAIQKNGLTRGSVLSLHRLLRCHPWSPGGVDEP